MLFPRAFHGQSSSLTRGSRQTGIAIARRASLKWRRKRSRKRRLHWQAGNSVFLNSVRIQQYLAGLAGLQSVHAFAEVSHRHAVSNDRRKIQFAGLEQRIHLVPGLVHEPAIDALHGSALENKIIGQVELNWLGRN